MNEKTCKRCDTEFVPRDELRPHDDECSDGEWYCMKCIVDEECGCCEL